METVTEEALEAATGIATEEALEAATGIATEEALEAATGIAMGEVMFMEWQVREQKPPTGL